MAFTWKSTWAGNEDWYKKAMDSGLYFSDYDLYHSSLDPNYAFATFQNKMDYANAATPEERMRYNQKQEELRATKGFSGGSAGDRFDLLPEPAYSTGGGSIPYTGSTGNWAGAMNDTFDALKTYGDYRDTDYYTSSLGKVMDYGPFEYDHTKDPLYSVYKKEYTREGQRAQAEALAQAAAITGGMPSTAAMTAATQAGDYYAAQLADKIPELRAQAYSEYNQGFDNLLRQHSAADTDNRFQYGKYTDGYNRLLDQIGLASDRYDTELSQRDRAAGILADLGNMSGYESLYGSGYQAAYDAQQARQRQQEAAELAAGANNYALMEQYLGLEPGTLQAAYDSQRNRDDQLAAAEAAAKMGNYSLLEQYYGLEPGTLQNYRDSGGGIYDLPTPEAENPLGGLTLPDEVWKEIGTAAAGDPAIARQYLTQYYDGLTDSQRNILARYGGISTEELKRLGGASSIGKDALGAWASMLPAPEISEYSRIAQEIENANFTTPKEVTNWLGTQGYKNAEAPLTKEKWEQGVKDNPNAKTGTYAIPSYEEYLQIYAAHIMSGEKGAIKYNVR